MKYHLYENWKVTVDFKNTRAEERPITGAKYSFSFDFIVSTNEKWCGIVDTAERIIKEKLGHASYEITQISLGNGD